MNVSGALKLYRAERGLSQAELAKQLGVTQTMIAYIENGQRGISVKMAKKLAPLLHTDFAALLE